LILADTHCHLNFEIFREDLEAVLDRASRQGVCPILIPAIDLKTSERALQICDQYPNLFAAVGVHPGEAGGWTAQTQRALESFLAHPKVVAIGEIGLDYYHMHHPIELQKEVFKAQLQLAMDHDLPVIIHSRSAASDVWALLSSWYENLITQRKSIAQRPGVFHSYDGKIDLAKEAVEKKFFIGMDGPVTYPKSQIQQEILSLIPVQNILLETDSPFLTPLPHRGKRNEPSFLLYIAAKIAHFSNMSLQKVAAITSQNANSLFAWETFD
jgi:TatD DNase family protein